jgi:hypothetical protein
MIKTFCNWRPLASRIVGKSICCRSVAVEFCTVLKDYWKTDGLPTWNSSGMEQGHILPNLLHDFSPLEICMASVLFSSLRTLSAATCKKICTARNVAKIHQSCAPEFLVPKWQEEEDLCLAKLALCTSSSNRHDDVSFEWSGYLGLKLLLL